MTTIITKNGTGVPANSSLATGELAVDPTNKKIYTSSNGTNVIEVASTTGIDDNATSTAITIDANENVGIGNTSPDDLLHIKSGAPALRIEDTSVAGEYTRILQNGGGFFIQVDEGNVNAGSYFRVDVDGSEAMRIDSSGNVGIGTDAPADNLHVRVSDAGMAAPNSRSAAVFERNADCGITIASNPANNGLIYFGDNLSSTVGEIRYNHADDSMSFGTNGGGPDVTIDSSGRVGIGETNPDSTLSIVGNDYTGAPTVGSYGTLSLTSGSSLGSGGSITFGAEQSSEGFAAIKGSLADGSTNTNGSLKFYVRQSTSDSAMKETMVLRPGGNVGIGETNPACPLEIRKDAAGEVELLRLKNNNTNSHALYFYVDDDSNLTRLVSTGNADGSIAFGRAANESMRIDSSGNLLVGTTVAPFTLVSAASTNGISLEKSTSYLVVARTNSDSAAMYLNKGTYTTGTEIFAQFLTGSTTRGTIDYNGTLTRYNTSSDVRLKENIVDAPAGNIDDIKVRSFDWKDNGNHQTYGMIAQELFEVAPEAVSQGATEDDMWGVDYSKLVPMMIKEIQDLKAEVAALKGA